MDADRREYILRRFAYQNLHSELLQVFLVVHCDFDDAPEVFVVGFTGDRFGLLNALLDYAGGFFIVLFV